MIVDVVESVPGAWILLLTLTSCRFRPCPFDYGQRRAEMRIVRSFWGNVCRWSRAAGPYLLIEMLLPGGTLVALLLFLHRRART
jgi:hypothetical protein